MAVDDAFDFFGVDVLAARADDGSRGAAFDVEPAVLVQLAEILCQKPAVLGEGRGSGLGVLEIATGYVVSLDGYLAMSGEVSVRP